MCYRITFARKSRKQTPPRVDQENEEPDHVIVTSSFEDCTIYSKEEASSNHSYTSSEQNRKSTRRTNMLPLKSSDYPKLPELPKEPIPENEITNFRTRTSRYDNSSETETKTGKRTRQSRFSQSTLDIEPYSYSHQQSNNEYHSTPLYSGSTTPYLASGSFFNNEPYSYSSQSSNHDEYHSTPLNATNGPYYHCSSTRTQQSSMNDYYSLSNANSKNQSSYSPGHYRQQHESPNLPYPYDHCSSAAQSRNDDYYSLNLDKQSYSPYQQSNNASIVSRGGQQESRSGASISNSSTTNTSSSTCPSFSHDEYSSSNVEHNFSTVAYPCPLTEYNMKNTYDYQHYYSSGAGVQHPCDRQQEEYNNTNISSSSNNCTNHGRGQDYSSSHQQQFQFLDQQNHQQHQVLPSNDPRYFTLSSNGTIPSNEQNF